MKINTLIILLLMGTVAAYGQVSENVISIEDEAFQHHFQNAEIPIVRGKFLNLPEELYDKIKMSYSVVTPTDQLQVKKTSSLNADGSFELELDYAFPYQQIWLNAGPFYAGIYANTELFIELDAEVLSHQKGVRFNGPGVKYLGEDGELNTFLNNHVLFERDKQLEISKSIMLLERERALPDREFTSKLDSLYALWKELDEEFIRQNPSAHAWIINNERQSDYYGDLINWYWGKEMPADLFEAVKAHKPYLVSNSGMGFYKALFYYLSFKSRTELSVDLLAFRDYSKLGEKQKLQLDSIQVLGDKMLQNQPYDSVRHMGLVQDVYQFLSDTIFIVHTQHTIGYLDKHFAHPKADLLKMNISSRDHIEKKIIAEAVLNSVQTGWVKNVLQAEHEINLEKLASIDKILKESKPMVAEGQLGEPVVEMPSGAKLYKVDNMRPEALLANLKNAFENKALVIDFWATWCAPCIQEMPYSKKLHEETEGLPVEFVYLCTSYNSNIERWKSMVAELGLAGTHIFVEQSIEDELMNLFSVSTFPSYVFINKNGEYEPGAISRMSMLSKEKLADLIE